MCQHADCNKTQRWSVLYVDEAASHSAYEKYDNCLNVLILFDMCYMYVFGDGVDDGWADHVIFQG